MVNDGGGWSARKKKDGDRGSLGGHEMMAKTKGNPVHKASANVGFRRRIYYT